MKPLAWIVGSSLDDPQEQSHVKIYNIFYSCGCICFFHIPYVLVCCGGAVSWCREKRVG